ncbi:MAG: hypothetical protein IPH23_04195 [Gammaproteobacteria bacterium]|nr:hypothetical protein [Gammaproteobacteria bacterium]
MSAPKKPLNLAVKPLAAAVTVASAMMLASQAQAVNVSQNGLGEVLLFPYYTVRNNIDTNINITNTSENTVIFKIRFREAHNSRDARDFNVVLSPYDVWNATVTLSPDGSAARIRTADQSCTAGQLPIDLGNGVRAIDFTNFDYINGTGIGPWDGGPTSLDRTKEGHIEVIQMASLAPTNPGAPSPALNFPNDGDDTPEVADSIGYNAQHVNGVPRSCTIVRQQLGAVQISATRDTVSEPINVLKGSFSLIKATEGKAFAGTPTVLANFFNPNGVDGTSNVDLLVEAASQLPSLNQALPAVVDVIDQAVAAPVVDDFIRPVDAVTAAISRVVVANQYSVNPANAAKTDWVISFPTKYWYVDEREAAVGLSANGPNPPAYYGEPPFERSTTFQWPRDAQGQPTGDDCAPVKVRFRFFDREEGEVIAVDNGFSPPPPGTPADAICFETQVVTFDNSDLFGSPIDANVNLAAAGFVSGWMRLEFPEAGTIVGDTFGYSFTGLPVIGFAATSLENGTNGNAVLNYGQLWDHGYVTDISPVIPYPVSAP